MPCVFRVLSLSPSLATHQSQHCIIVSLAVPLVSYAGNFLRCSTLILPLQIINQSSSILTNNK
jgi:hypothetical protein